jgi:hypothetical protein
METPPSQSRECQFCSAWFSRVDAARRHAKRCENRGGRILLDRKRGRPARSCDQCSRVKVHCKADEEGPCRRCIPRGLRCSLDQHYADLVNGHAPPADLPNDDDRRDGRMALSSLLNLTDDYQDFLTEQTIGMEPDGVPLGPTCLPPTEAGVLGDEVMYCLDPSILLLFDYGQCDTPVTLDGPYLDQRYHLDDFPFTKPWESAMSARLNLLEAELSSHATSSHDRSLTLDLLSYRSFFNVGNVHRFITTFCRKRHYRYPIIHWPTFEAENVSLALLLVVTLTGAAYSFGEDRGAAYAVQARAFYNLADAYVFQKLGNHLGDLQMRGSSSADSIELCQAALLMYALDTLPTGDMAMQHTAVAVRLPMLVSALRRLGFVSVRHESSEDWHAFIRREQMIRIVAWTFCADCLATLTCNKPPSFLIPEMRGDLPCDPKVWESDEASFLELSKGSSRTVSHNLRDLTSRWLNNDLSNSIDSLGLPLFCLHIMLCGTSPMHVYSCVCERRIERELILMSPAFQQILFNSHVATSLVQQSGRLLAALDTWRYLWNETIEKLAENERAWLGVARHISDLERLTRRIIEVAAPGSRASDTSRYLQRIPSCGMREIHEFMQEFVVKGSFNGTFSGH